MPIHFSKSYEDKMKRIKDIPKLVNGYMEVTLKEDAVGLIDTFHDGLINNDLGLYPLAEQTVINKIRLGFGSPENPLVGKGDDRQSAKDSYANMLRLQKIKNGWKVVPSKALHWSGKVTLDKLFAIHEYGAKITTKNGTIINIPPRPAYLISYNRWMSKRKADGKTTGKGLTKKLRDYIMEIKSFFTHKKDIDSYEDK
jgi:hypothetical protein